MKANVNFQPKQMLKLLFIAGLSLILLIPLVFLKESISERESNLEKTVSEVGASWGGRQTITGPYIEHCYNLKADKGGEGPAKAHLTDIFPESFEANVTMKSSNLKKGIFNIPVYGSEVIISGTFSLDSASRASLKDSSDLKLCLGLGDLKGIEDKVRVVFAGRGLDCQNRKISYDTGAYSEWHQSKEKTSPEITAPFPLSLIEGRDSIPYEITLNLKGAASIMFAPVGGQTIVRIESDYPNPSFTGAFLPSERNVSAEGFSAVWKVNSLNRDVAQVNKDAHIYELLYGSLFGVDLFVPVSHYQQCERAIKYALLVILLTMLSIFLMEIWTRIPVNYLQYVLTGADLVLFYTLLFSFSEHIGFGWSFLVAAMMTIVLMVLYMRSVLGSWKRSLCLGALAALLYSYIFILLRMGDFAFLVGSIGLFILLALVMFFSQKAFKKSEVEQSDNQ